jgi:hypothetical protein
MKYSGHREDVPGQWRDSELGTQAAPETAGRPAADHLPPSNPPDELSGASQVKAMAASSPGTEYWLP